MCGWTPYDVFSRRATRRSPTSYSALSYGGTSQLDVPVWRDGKVAYDLAASLPLRIFTDIIMRQRPEPDWTIAVFDREGTVIARSRDNEQFVGRPASPSLYADLMNRFEGALDTTTFDGTVVLSGFTHAPLSGWSAAVGIPKSSLTIELWRSSGAAATNNDATLSRSRNKACP